MADKQLIEIITARVLSELRTPNTNASTEAAEGMQAFLEKRKANFKGY